MGWEELLFIAALIIVLIRPKDMPALMRRAGQFVGSCKRTLAEFQHEMERTETNLRIQSEEILEIEKNTPAENIKPTAKKSSKKTARKKPVKKIGKKDGK